LSFRSSPQAPRQDACVAATPVGKPSATDEAASRLNFR
jgi:hypothetical protein